MPVMSRFHHQYEYNNKFWPWLMWCWLTLITGMMVGAAQTLALYWSLLSSHCCQNGWGREQCLAYSWTHSHQPKQVHRVRPLSYGEDHRREAQCGAQSSDSLNLSTPLLLSLHIPVCWKVNTLRIFFAVIAHTLLEFEGSWSNRLW